MEVEVNNEEIRDINSFNSNIPTDQCSKRKHDNNENTLNSSSSLFLSIHNDKWRWKKVQFIESLMKSHEIPHSSITKTAQSTEAHLTFNSQQQKESAINIINQTRDQQGKLICRWREGKSHKIIIQHTPQKKLKKLKQEKQQLQQNDDEDDDQGNEQIEPVDADADALDGVDEITQESISGDAEVLNVDLVVNRMFGINKNELNENRGIVETVTPFAHLPYEIQLKRKNRQAASALKAATRALQQIDPSFIPHSENQTSICNLEPIIAATTTTGYRNKCEFSIGKNKEGKKMVGFLLGKFTEGIVTIGAVDECVNVSDAAKLIANHMIRFLENDSYEVYNKLHHTGVWRLCTVRNTRIGEIMVIIQIDAQALNTEQIDTLHNSLITHFTSPSFSPIHSLYIQHWSGFSNAAPESAAPKLLYGVPYIHEHLLSLTFQISPSSFFQTNSEGAERLYNKIREWANVNEETIIYDICCGTGTIGLIMATQVKKVIGLELNAAAIEDAKINAQLNHINNATYICGKAEDQMNTALREHCKPSTNPTSTTSAASSSKFPSKVNIVAIVDPPRSGLHPSVIKAIRGFAAVARLIYVSCNPKSLTENLVRFCSPPTKRMRGEPFHCIRAVAVDMFPHTDHCEMIVELRRGHSTTANETSSNSTVSDNTKSSVNQANGSDIQLSQGTPDT